jgi:RNA polymerase sigma factor (sigma-70 family)
MAPSHGNPPEKETRRDLFERLFNQHNDALIRFLRSRLRSVQDAKEVAQETFVRLMQLERPEAIIFFQSFLFRTAINIANDRHRKRTMEQRHATLALFYEDTPSAEQTELQREAVREIVRCLEQLPPKCQRAFMLNRVHGFSTTEIAEQMRMTDRMVRLYLSRATLHCRGGLALDETHELSIARRSVAMQPGSII